MLVWMTWQNKSGRVRQLQHSDVDGLWHHSEPVYFFFRIWTGQRMWCTRPTMSAAAREGRSWAPGEASEAALSGSLVSLNSLIWYLSWGSSFICHDMDYFRNSASFDPASCLSHLPTRFVWCREDYHQFCSRRVPCVPCYPLLLAGWRQHSPWPEQESGLHCWRPRGKHPTCCWGGQTVCRCWAGVCYQFHLSFQQGQETVTTMF